MHLRYRCHQRNQKRVVFNQPASRGKKHFWGQPNKNYGFYTTDQQQEFGKKRQIQRPRIKSGLNILDNQGFKRANKSNFFFEDSGNPQDKYRIKTQTEQNNQLSYKPNFSNRKLTPLSNQNYKDIVQSVYHSLSPPRQNQNKQFVINKIKRHKKLFKIEKNYDVSLPSIVNKKSQFKTLDRSNSEEQHQKRQVQLRNNFKRYIQNSRYSPTYISSLGNPFVRIQNYAVQ